MRISLMIALAAIGVASAIPAQAAPSAKMAAKAEETMAKALKGRVAGKPVDCIQQSQIRQSQIIDGKAILYTVGQTVYVNEPKSGANFLNAWNILVTDTHSSQLCSIDIVRLVDSSSRMPSGSVGLGQFVPYTKPKV